MDILLTRYQYMKRFNQFFTVQLDEDLKELEYNGNDNNFAVALCASIDDAISSVDTKIEIDVRTGRSNSNKIGISQMMPDKDRAKYAGLAKDIIDSAPDLERDDSKLPPPRKEKDYAFKHKDMDKYIYVNCRPAGGRSKLGDDPHELMTAALCLLPKLGKYETTDDIDLLIEVVRSQVKKISGAKQSQIDAMMGDWPNIIKAISAAQSIHKAGWGGSDKAYITGQAWDSDVKQFQRTKYGMQDFNSSDFILKKGNKWLGVSLKKKKRLNEDDPTLINKAFTSLLNGSKELDKVRTGIDKDAGAFYLHVIKLARRLKIVSPELEQDMKKSKPSATNWKPYVVRIPNDLVNRVLKGKKTLFKVMGKTIVDNGPLIANQLVNLIFKADLKDLQKFDFDFALVTGIGDYGVKKGVDIQAGEYKDIDTVTSKLDDLFSNGKPNIIFTPGEKQAFDVGATAANLKFDLMIGKISIANITLRYKGDFRSAPNFNATMTKEFKQLYK